MEFLNTSINNITSNNTLCKKNNYVEFIKSDNFNNYNLMILYLVHIFNYYLIIYLFFKMFIVISFRHIIRKFSRIGSDNYNYMKNDVKNYKTADIGPFNIVWNFDNYNCKIFKINDNSINPFKYTDEIGIKLFDNSVGFRNQLEKIVENINVSIKSDSYCLITGELGKCLDKDTPYLFVDSNLESDNEIIMILKNICCSRGMENKFLILNSNTCFNVTKKKFSYPEDISNNNFKEILNKMGIKKDIIIFVTSDYINIYNVSENSSYIRLESDKVTPYSLIENDDTELLINNINNIIEQFKIKDSIVLFSNNITNKKFNFKDFKLDTEGIYLNNSIEMNYISSYYNKVINNETEEDKVYPFYITIINKKFEITY